MFYEGNSRKELDLTFTGNGKKFIVTRNTATVASVFVFTHVSPPIVHLGVGKVEVT